MKFDNFTGVHTFPPNPLKDYGINGGAWLASSSNAFVMTSGYINSGGYVSNSSYFSYIHNSSYFLNDFTCEFWVKRDGWAGGSYNRLVDKNYTNGFVIARNSSSDNLFFQVNGGGLTSTANLTDQTWTHVCAVRSGTTAYFYLNGSLDSYGSINGSVLTSTNPLGIGQDISTNLGNEQFLGSYDEFRLWNYARTANQIATNYNTTVATGQSGLINYLKFDIVDSGTQPAVNSYSGYFSDKGFIGGFFGVDWITGDSPNNPVITNSGYFNSGCYFDYNTWLVGPPSTGYNVNDFTIEFWMKRNAAWGDVYAFLYTLSSSFTSNGLSIYRNGGSNNLQIQYGGNGSDNFTSVNTISPDVWTHVALVKEGTASKLYISGVQDSTHSAAIFPLNPGKGPTIGTEPTLSTFRYQGLMDEIRFWNYARSATQISNNFKLLSSDSSTGSFSPIPFSISSMISSLLNGGVKSIT